MLHNIDTRGKLLLRVVQQECVSCILKSYPTYSIFLINRPHFYSIFNTLFLRFLLENPSKYFPKHFKHIINLPSSFKIIPLTDRYSRPRRQKVQFLRVNSTSLHTILTIYFLWCRSTKNSCSFVFFSNISFSYIIYIALLIHAYRFNAFITANAYFC